MNFRTLDRVVCVFAFVFSSCIGNAPMASAAPWSRVESVEGSALRSVSVEDVQRILAEDKGKSDTEVARQLSGVELTERMSSAILQSLEQGVPGTKSRWALVALADASVFLSPAAADVLPQTRPDLNEQQRILGLTVEYHRRTLRKLPDFYATRTTIRFDDMPRVENARARRQNDSSWRKVGGSKVIVAYRDGEEVVDPREWVKHSTHPEREGLITRGVFAPILSTVFRDSALSEMIWERWERGDKGTLAVFRYRVSENQSHYAVGVHRPSSDKGEVELTTGYHGEVAIDPATGTILRLTVEADLGFEASRILRGDIMVEYGPVEISGKTFICPIRSVTICRFAYRVALGPQTTLLNDVMFTDYHEFRGESRLLPEYHPAPNH